MGDDMTDKQRANVEKWMALDPDTRAEIADYLAGRDQRHRQSTLNIASTLDPVRRAALPEMFEDIAQDPARYGLDPQDKFIRTDLMQRAGYLLDEDPDPDEPTASEG